MARIMEGCNLPNVSIKPHIIYEPNLNGEIPFSLAQKKHWRYMCSECRALSDDFCDIQAHVHTHDSPYRKPIKKERVYKPRGEKLRKPTSKESKDIRKAINERRQFRLPTF
jgi:hypothetical protein